MDAYNQALENVQNANYMSEAELLIEAALQQNMNDLHTGIDDLADAVTDMSTVFAVADLAEDAQEEANNGSGDVDVAEGLQDYINANEAELVITQEEVQVYNESLEVIETAAQSAAVFVAAANNEDFVNQLDDTIDEFGVNIAAAGLTYTQANDALVMDYVQGMQPGSVLFNDFYTSTLMENFVQTADVLMMGQQDPYFQDFMFFRETGGTGTFNPYGEIPPNVLLFTNNPQSGGHPEAYTDQYGVIIEFELGDEVYDPFDGSYIGKLHMDGNFVWDPDAYNRYTGVS